MRPVLATRMIVVQICAGCLNLSEMADSGEGRVDSWDF